MLLLIVSVLFFNCFSKSIPVSGSERHPAFHQEFRCNKTNFTRRWMSKIPDSRPLQLLSIPGTHDSLARYGGEQFQCQTMQLHDQLEAGIRALDMRCRHVANSFLIYHAFVYQHISFDQVLQICRTFLKSNPTEMIIMRIKKEWLAEGNTRDFEATFRQQYLNKFPELFWIPSKLSDVNNLTLGQVRGKIVIFQDFDSRRRLDENGNTTSIIYGPHWTDTIIQDDFTLLTIWSLYSKWLKVKSHLYATNASLNANSTHQQDVRPFYVNFLSGSIGAKPYFVASGHTKWGSDAPRQYFGLVNSHSPYHYDDFPRDKCMLGGRYCLVYFDGTNMLTYHRLTTEPFRFVGIIYSDFPGCGLIRTIIDINDNIV
ncbi:hypothetical protein BLOT_004223 [Blomia tropicalis]|nr:hypothetical protein BLOT_004223 [Blomia tropicalis]